MKSRSTIRTFLSIFSSLSVFVALMIILFFAGRYDPQNNSQRQTIVVDRRGADLPRVPLSWGFVPVLGTKCVRGDRPVEVAGTGPNWIVLLPVGGVSVEGNSGSTTLDPNAVDPDTGEPVFDERGCRTREFENPIPDEIADAARRHGEITLRIFGEEGPVDPLSLNPLDWRPETGLPGFFPVDADWRTEDFIIFDDTKEAV